MKAAIRLLSVFAVLVCGAILLGIWPPDIISKTPKLVATATNGTGHVFQVIQYWNDDFYAVVLKHQLPNGERRSVLVDPDADKLWHCTIAVGQTNSELTVTCRNRILSQYDWSKMELTRPNGVKVAADPE